MKIRCNRTNISFEATVLKLIFGYSNTLAAGLHQEMGVISQPEMGVISRVTDSEILFVSFDVIL